MEPEVSSLVEVRFEAPSTRDVRSRVRGRDGPPGVPLIAASGKAAWRTGILTGRVTDEDGNPLEDVTFHFLTSAYEPRLFAEVRDRSTFNFEDQWSRWKLRPKPAITRSSPKGQAFFANKHLAIPRRMQTKPIPPMPNATSSGIQSQNQSSRPPEEAMAARMNTGHQDFKIFMSFPPSYLAGSVGSDLSEQGRPWLSERCNPRARSRIPASPAGLQHHQSVVQVRRVQLAVAV